MGGLPGVVLAKSGEVSASEGGREGGKEVTGIKRTHGCVSNFAPSQQGQGAGMAEKLCKR